MKYPNFFGIIYFLMFWFFQYQTTHANGFFLKNTPNAHIQFSDWVDVRTIEKNIEFPIAQHNALPVPNTDQLIDSIIGVILWKEKIGTLHLQKQYKSGVFGWGIFLLGTNLRWYRDISEEENMDAIQEYEEDEGTSLYYNSQTRVYTTFSVEKSGKYSVKIYPHDVEKLKLFKRSNTSWHYPSILLFDPAISIHITQANVRTYTPTVPVWWSNDTQKMHTPINMEDILRKYKMISHGYNSSWVFISPDQDIKLIIPYHEMIFDIPYAGEYTFSFTYQYITLQDDNGRFQQFFQE